VKKNRSINGNVLLNELAAAGGNISLHVQQLSNPSFGTLILDATGAFVYIPHNGFSGEDSFTYHVVDDLGNSTTVTTRITVDNKPPKAKDDQFYLLSESFSGNVLLNDSEHDDDGLRATLITSPSQGQVTWNENGSFTYHCDPDYRGFDPFEYRVTDPSGSSSVARVTIVNAFGHDIISEIERLRKRFGRGVDYFGGGGNEQMMSGTLARFAQQPILAGYATPGSMLTGRIYDDRGAQISQVTVTADSAGNWAMNFYEVDGNDGLYLVVDHVANENVAVGELHDFRLTEDTYRTLQMSTGHSSKLNIGKILKDSPSCALESLHKQNGNPLRIL
jgi:Bacterial Ig domain